MDKKFVVTSFIANELLSYNNDTGICTWKTRDSRWFNQSNIGGVDGNVARWNKKFSGKELSKVSKSGYITVGIFNRSYEIHRIIWLMMTGEWPNVIDHINGDRSDNRWENLRNVDTKENAKNSRKSSNNTSGVTGVSKHSCGKWRAEITDNGKYVYLGIYNNFSDAVNVRKEAEKAFGYHENHGR